MIHMIIIKFTIIPASLNQFNSIYKVRYKIFACIKLDMLNELQQTKNDYKLNINTSITALASQSNLIYKIIALMLALVLCVKKVCLKIFVINLI